MRLPEQLPMLPELVAGCSERPSSKAAASGEAKRTLGSTLSLCAPRERRWRPLSTACQIQQRTWKRMPLKSSISSVRRVTPHVSVYMLERARGFEPLTTCLGSKDSTTELRPLTDRILPGPLGQVKKLLVLALEFNQCKLSPTNLQSIGFPCHDRQDRIGIALLLFIDL
jgi:hypothetical protein